MESDTGVRILSPEKLFSPGRNIKSELESRIQESQETDPLDETNIKVSYMMRKKTSKLYVQGPDLCIKDPKALLSKTFSI